MLLCLGVGLYLSIRMKFPQIRFLKEMVHLLGAKEESENGITPFQAFATTVGARVGMGNIAGVASAIYFGGPGSVFWMWIITLIGAASAYTESALGQAYKVKNPDGEYMADRPTISRRDLNASRMLFCLRWWHFLARDF